VDTGAAKNYVKPIKELKKIIHVERPFIVSSIHGSSKITNKCLLKIFGQTSPFFMLDTLSLFDAILGFDSLDKAGAVLDLKNKIMKYQNKTEQLNFHYCHSVNFTDVNDIVVPMSVKEKFKGVILERSKAFSTSNEALPFNTSVIATIRTIDNEPIYSKLYPYPNGVSDFVNNEIKQLLKDGIIRPSKSPYNSPVWVVDKKGVDNSGNKK